MNRAFAIAIGVAVVVCAPAVALAKPRAAIVAFDDDNGELQDLVADSLDGDFSIVATSKVTRAMDKLGFDVDMTSKQLKKLATELDVEVVVRGEVNKRGTHRVLHIRLFKDGKKVRGFKIEFASARSSKFKTALKDKLLERLEGGDAAKPAEEPKDEPAGKDEPKDEPPPKDEPKGKHRIEATTAGGDEGEDKTDKVKPKDDEDPVEGKGKKGKKGKSTAKHGDDDEEIDGEVEEDDKPAPGTPHTANRAAVRVDLGMSMSSRTLSWTSRNFEEAPKTYTNSPVPGARVEGDIYPLAFGNPNGFLGGLGIGGEYDQTLKLNLTSTVQMGTQFPVKQSHFSVGPRIRIVFGKKATSPAVILKAGYDARQFKVDRSKLDPGNIIDLPDVAYKGFSAGLDLRIPFTPKVALIAGGGAIFVTTTGPIQTANEYGRAKVTGGQAKVGVDVSITNRIGVRIQGEGTQMGFAFQGTGQMAINRDGDPTTKDVGGAADRYIGGSLTVGVLY